jgi:hypothetical protein
VYAAERRTCIVVVGASIGAQVLDEQEWRETLAPDWNGTALALGEALVPRHP